MPVDLAVKLKMFMKGMKRHVSVKSFKNGDSGIIGKKKMDFKVYEKEEGEEFLFARCFLTLEWNLMARSERVVYANFFHVTWEDDCFVFRFARSKTDQTGRNRDQLWHVYATPNNPATCPILALATYIFANPGLTQRNFKGDSPDCPDRDVGDNNGRLFPGGTNMVALWIASVGLSRTISKSSVSLASPLMIWVRILRERDRAALLAQVPLCPRRWFQFACEQCGVWAQ